MIQLPTAYAETYAKACGHDEGLAVNYIRHTTLGDPELDPVMEELSCMPTEELHRFIGAGIEQHGEVLRKAPQPLREFFANLKEPEWLDYEAFRPGIRAFHANVDLMLVAFVTGVLVEGFSTMIAKSFNITGRVASTKRRLQQNNRHMMDIFFPGGLYRNGDGWKLSMRIRIIHSRNRALLNRSDDWNHEAWGTPVSAAHLGLAISVFSKRLLEYSQKVGANFTEKEKTAFSTSGATRASSWGFPKPSSIPTPRRQPDSTRSATCANRRRTPIRSPWRTCSSRPFRRSRTSPTRKNKKN